MIKPCDGCDAVQESQRCIGCLHDFGTPESAWVRRLAKEHSPIETLATSYVPSKLQHLQQSQHAFEVVRDIATLMKGMKNGDKVSIEIECRHTHYDWKCDGDNQPCGPSEAATAMRKAYEGVFNSQHKDNE